MDSQDTKSLKASAGPPLPAPSDGPWASACEPKATRGHRGSDQQTRRLPLHVPHQAMLLLHGEKHKFADQCGQVASVYMDSACNTLTPANSFTLNAPRDEMGASSVLQTREWG